jgi:nitroreductase
LTLSIEEVNDLKHAPVVDGVLPIFHLRWSPRSFSDRDVPSADLAKVFEAARWAASSFNEQPWRWLVGKRNSTAYNKILDSLMPFNQAWAGNAPVLILGTAKTTFSHNDTPNRVALYDLGAASSYLTLQAAALGLVTHQMGGFDQDKARKSFAIPEHFLIARLALERANAGSGGGSATAQTAERDRPFVLGLAGKPGLTLLRQLTPSSLRSTSGLR